jgi:hypothetical protein
VTPLGLGLLTYNGDGDWTTSTLIRNESVTIYVCGSESGINEECKKKAVHLFENLAKFVDQAFKVLAGYPGFGGVDRVRRIYTLKAVVVAWPEIQGGFWMEFSCSEDRNLDAIWRVEFQDWAPKSHSRDD